MEPVLLASDLSSYTDGSASVQPTKPSRVREEDVKKFVPRRDVQVKSHTEIEELITKVEGVLLQVSCELAAIQYTVQWRTKAPDSVTEFAKIRTKLCKVENKLHGTRGIDTHIAAVVELGAIPGIIQKVQKLEIECLLSQKKLARLEALCAAKQYQDEVVRAKSVMPALFNTTEACIQTVDAVIKEYVATIDPKLYDLLVKGNNDEIKEFISVIGKKEVSKVANKTERIKLRATKWVYLEMLRASLAAIMKNHEAQGGVRFEWRSRVLKALIEYVERDLGVKEPVIKRPKKVLSAQEESAYGSWLKSIVVPVKTHVELSCDELVALQEATSHDYGFWKHAPSQQKWYNWGKYYAATGAIGTEMEQEIGQTLNGLLLKLKKQVVDLAQGDDAPLEKRTIEDELDHYETAIVTLEMKVDEHFEKICKADYDELTQPLFDYAFGLSMGIEEAKRLLKVACACRKSSAKAIFLAVKEIRQHYGAYDTSSELENVLKLYYSVAQMKAAKENMPLEAGKPFDQFLKRTAEYLHEVHATKDPEILKLAQSERKVARIVLGGKALGGLYEEGEDQKALPLLVIKYISKRIMQQLFLPSDAYDMELELVLHQLRTKFENQYYVSLNVYEHMRAVVGGYEAVYEGMRLDKAKGLEPAQDIALLAFRASNSSWDLLSYTEAWQRLFEFVRGHHDRRIIAMYNMLAERLHEAANKNEHDDIYPIVAKTDIEAWNIEAPDIFLRKVQEESLEAEVAFQTLFGSIVLRMVAACLFAEDIPEQVAAQQRVVSLFKKPAYAECIDALSDDIKMLLAENAMKKVFLCSENGGKQLHLEPAEIEFLLSGPIRYFFDETVLDPDTTTIQMVLYKLIKQEGPDGPLAKKCQTSWGLEFDRWYEGYDLLCQGNLIKVGLDTYRQDNELLF